MDQLVGFQMPLFQKFKTEVTDPVVKKTSKWEFCSTASKCETGSKFFKKPKDSLKKPEQTFKAKRRNSDYFKESEQRYGYFKEQGWNTESSKIIEPKLEYDLSLKEECENKLDNPENKFGRFIVEDEIDYESLALSIEEFRKEGLCLLEEEKEKKRILISMNKVKVSNKLLEACQKTEKRLAFNLESKTKKKYPILKRYNTWHGFPTNEVLHKRKRMDNPRYYKKLLGNIIKYIPSNSLKSRIFTII